MQRLKSHASFNGQTTFWAHDSRETKTKMKVSTFVPGGGARAKGVVIWLSGLTCTDENFQAKAGAQRALAEAGLVVVCPDTSPRGLDLPHEHEAYDFGSGAGFYVDATTPGYRDHYRMKSYVANELYAWIEAEFQAKGRISIMGHSMGGHGALTIALREPEKFRSVSAFAPIVNPTQCSWGEKAFNGYLGADRAAWAAYDACEMLRAGRRHPDSILVHQGTADEFLEKQLLTPRFAELARGLGGQACDLRMAEGYDHSYYFIASFIDEHVRHHARALS